MAKYIFAILVSVLLFYPSQGFAEGWAMPTKKAAKPKWWAQSTLLAIIKVPRAEP